VDSIFFSHSLGDGTPVGEIGPKRLSDGSGDHGNAQKSEGSSVEIPKIVIRYQSRNVSAQQIAFALVIENVGSVPVELSDLKVRYWYSESPESRQVVNCDYCSLGAANIAVQVERVEPARQKANCVAIVTFRGTSERALGNGETFEVQLRLHNSMFTVMASQDHYSSDRSKNDKFYEWDKVTAYVKDALLWGVEPSV